MGRMVVLGALALAVLGVVLFVLPRAPDPSAPKPDAGARASADADAAVPTSYVAPARPHLDSPGPAEVPPTPPLPATAAIRGHVTEHGRPVAGFPVELRTAAPHAVTDESGDFVIEKIPPGRHVVVAEDRATGRTSPRTPVELAAGDDLEIDLEIVQTGRLRIEVVDLDGAPVPGATVIVVGPAAVASYVPGDGSAISSPQVREPVGLLATDRAGAIERWGLTAGSLTVIVTAGHATVQQTLDVHGEQEHIRIQLRMRGGQRIAGTVRDDRGEPIVGAEVSLVGQTTKTDASGQFAFAHLLDTQYRVEAWAGIEDNRAHLDIQGGTLDAVIVLPRTATLTGTASGFTHDPWIQLDGPGFGRGRPHVRAGVIEPTVLAAGTYRVVARGAPGEVAAADDVVLEPGGTTTIHMTPSAAASVLVHAVRFPGGAPVSGAMCSSGFGTRPIADDGAGALVTGLAPGRLQVSCATGGLDVSETGYGDAHVIAVAGGTVDARVYIVEGARGRLAGHLGAVLDDTAVFTAVRAGGAASAAGISEGDQLLALDGVDLTPETIEPAQRFVSGSTRPFVARVRSKGGSYAIDLNVTPR